MDIPAAMELMYRVIIVLHRIVPVMIITVPLEIQILTQEPPAPNLVIVITARQHTTRHPTVHHLITHQVIIAHQVIVLQLIVVPAMEHLLIAHQVTIVRPLIVPLITPSLFIKQLTTGNS